MMEQKNSSGFSCRAKRGTDMKNRTDRSGRRALAVLGALALLASLPAHAQMELPRNRWQFGIHADAVMGIATASFTELPGVPNCLGLVSETAFTAGSGWGLSVGGVVGLARFGEGGEAARFGGNLRFGFVSVATLFEAEERIGAAAGSSGEVVPIIARYTVETRRNEIRLEPMLSYRFGGSVMALAGGRAGYLLGGTYRQREGIASPGNATYADGSRERNATGGDLRETNAFQAGISAGIAAEIPFSGGWFLRPELVGSLGLVSPVASTGWRPHELRAGISVLYSLEAEQSTPLEQGN